MALKTKPKAAAAPAASAKSAKGKVKGTAKAEKASEDAAAPAKPKEIYEEGTFARFTGYKSKVSKDEAVFKENDEVVIVEKTEDPKLGIVYVAVLAKDYAEYLENGDDNVTGGEVGPNEVVALKGAALEKARDQYTPIVVTGKLKKMLDKNNNVVEVAIELNQSIQETYFWLGGALAKILQDGAYLKSNGGDYDGEEAFNDFCQAEFAFKASKGQQLARVYRTFSAMPGFDPASLDAVGWSKAAIAERFVTEDNVDEIIEIATNTPQRELAATLKEKYVQESGKTASGKSASRATLVKQTLTFRLDEDSADTVKLALEAAMAQGGIQDMSLALEKICLEWANDHIDSDHKKKRIQSKASKAAAARAAAAPAPKEEKAAAPAKAAAKKPAGKK